MGVPFEEEEGFEVLFEVEEDLDFLEREDMIAGIV